MQYTPKPINKLHFQVSLVAFQTINTALLTASLTALTIDKESSLPFIFLKLALSIAFCIFIITFINPVEKTTENLGLSKGILYVSLLQLILNSTLAWYVFYFGNFGFNFENIFIVVMTSLLYSFYIFRARPKVVTE